MEIEPQNVILPEANEVQDPNSEDGSDGDSVASDTPSDTQEPPQVLSAEQLAQQRKQAARRRRTVYKKNQIPTCRVCFKSNNHLIHRKTYLMSTRCGHMICKICVRQSFRHRLYDCPICKMRNVMYTVHRVYF